MPIQVYQPTGIGDPPPESGTVTLVGTNTLQSVKTADYTNANWWGAFVGSYGGGIFVEDYGTHGAYVLGPSGGHNHSPVLGVAIFRLDDFTWAYLPPSGVSVKSQTGAASDYTEGELTASPYYEVDDECPCPPHPYHLHSVWPGGTKGRLITLTRAAITPGAINATSSHVIDLDTGLWSRLTAAQFDSGRCQTESSAVWFAALERWYLISQAYINFKSLQYLRASDMTIQTTEETSGFPPNPGAGGSYDVAFPDPVRGIIVMQRRDGTFMAFDPTNAITEALGWREVSHTGDCPTSNERWAYLPDEDAFYKIMSTGGTAMQKLTIPTDWLNDDWVIDEITLSQSVAPYGDSATGGTLGYGYLIPCPSRNRLYRFPLGTSATGATRQGEEIVP